MNRPELIELLKMYPKRWSDFYAGAKTTYPNEVPPMYLLREKFSEHLKKKILKVEDNGIIHFN